MESEDLFRVRLFDFFESCLITFDNLDLYRGQKILLSDSDVVCFLIIKFVDDFLGVKDVKHSVIHLTNDFFRIHESNHEDANCDGHAEKWATFLVPH